MKFDFSQNKIEKVLKKLWRFLPKGALVVFCLIFMWLAYISLWPAEDLVTKAEGDKKVNSLKINFNIKIFSELNKSPEVGVTAGIRNPFSN